MLSTSRWQTITCLFPVEQIITTMPMLSSFWILQNACRYAAQHRFWIDLFDKSPRLIWFWQYKLNISRFKLYGQAGATRLKIRNFRSYWLRIISPLLVLPRKLCGRSVIRLPPVLSHKRPISPLCLGLVPVIIFSVHHFIHESQNNLGSVFWNSDQGDFKQRHQQQNWEIIFWNPEEYLPMIDGTNGISLQISEPL